MLNKSFVIQMKQRKIVITTGTRADYGLLRPILHAMIDSKKIKLYLIVTGMHLSKIHGLTIRDIKKDGFAFMTLNMTSDEDSLYSMTRSLGKSIIDFAQVFHKVKPHINVILGDRDEMLASAIAASHMNIPNAHIHGGDKSGGIDEYNRHAITKISNIHFAATKNSKERIIKMGENPRFVFYTGSPAIDEIANNKITSKTELETKYHIKFRGDEILLIQHPVTTQSEYSEKQIKLTLNALLKVRKRIIAIAPNSDVGYRKILKQLQIFSKLYDSITIYPNMPREDYLGMLKNCGVLVGNSSSGMIEASYFDIPVVNIGIRQKNRERGKNVINIENNDVNSIYVAVMKSLKKNKSLRHHNTLNIFGDGKAAKKIVKCLEEISLNKELIEKQISY